MRFHLSRGSIDIIHETSRLGAIPLTLPGVHGLADAIAPELFRDGLSLAITEKDLRNPLGFELLLQVIMLNMVHYVFPRVHLTIPMAATLELQSMDSEINTIRNTAYLNRMNHLFILKDHLRGLPLVVAMPGPSLDMDFLRRRRESFVLLAAGRAAGKVLEAGITPDFIFIQDVIPAAWDLSFGSLGDRVVETVLVGNPMGMIHKYFKNFRRVMKAWNMYPFERDIFPKIPEIAPSTVSGAYSMARLLGADPVIFVGNDCGDPVPPPPPGQGPQSQTNLPWEAEGDHLVFTPTARMASLFLRFADEFSMRTSNSYVAGAQWIKARAGRTAKASPVSLFDRSLTRFTRFNSVLRPFDEAVLSGPCRMPELPRYDTAYDPADFLLRKKRLYAFAIRQLQQGSIPRTLFSRPQSCLLEGTDMARNDRTTPTDDDAGIMLENARRIMEHIEEARRELAAS
jgi:hypothetical protein